MNSEKVTIFEVGKRVVVGGMSWRQLGSDPRGETRATARMVNTRYGLVLETPNHALLCGLLPPLAPARARNAYSGAIWFANAIKGPTIYMRNLPSGEFWTIAARPGELDTRFDGILSEDATKNLVDQLLSEHMGGDAAAEKFQVIVEGSRIPASAMIERQVVTHASFAEIVASVVPHKTDRVVQLVGIKPSQILAVAAVVPIAIAGYFGWHAVQKAREQAAFEAQRAEMEKQRVIAEQLQNEAQVRMAQAVVEAMREDTATPAPQQVLDRCLAAVRGLSTNLGGWRLTKIGCAANGGGVDLSYSLDALDAGGIGTNGSLLYAAKQHFGTSPNIAFADGKATMHLSQTPVPQREPLTPVRAPRYADVLNEFVSHFQLVGQAYTDLHFKIEQPSPRSVTYLDPTDKSINGNPQYKQVPPERTYKKGALTINGLGLWLMDQVRVQWPFVSINSIELTPTGTDQDAYNWKIAGTYVTART